MKETKEENKKFCKCCGKELTGKKRLFCSITCKSSFYYEENKNYKNSYKSDRYLKRKLRLVLIKGGRCQKCGYNKNLSALSFHHVNPNEKRFLLSGGKFWTMPWDEALKELDNCILLCHNCHNEVHHPNTSLEKLQEKFGNDLIETKEKSKIKKEKRKLFLELKKNQKEKMIKERIKIIEESNIDFSKRGFYQKLKLLLKMSDKGCSNFLKKYMPDVYEKSYKLKLSSRKSEKS